MKKIGKHERVPEPAPVKSVEKAPKDDKIKKTLLQTYFTSLVCLLVCVSMFFGTTFAWFTDSVEMPHNELLIGTLAIELEHATFQSGVLGEYKKVEGDYAVFTDETKWEPGYTAVEKFRLTEQGDLAFGYEMNMEFTFADQVENADPNAQEVKDLLAREKAATKAITVWTYTGKDTDELDAGFEEMKASGRWKEVGTLYDVLTEHRALFSGKMDTYQVEGQDPGEVTHMIALHMDENYGNDALDPDIQGVSLKNISITLVAHQRSAESDAFGSEYDQDELHYNLTKEVANNESVAQADVNFIGSDYKSAIVNVEAVVPAGTVLESADVKQLTLTVTLPAMLWLLPQSLWQTTLSAAR